MLREGWLKDQMQKATKEVKTWPDWMTKLDQAEMKMEYSSRNLNKTYSCFVEQKSNQTKKH